MGEPIGDQYPPGDDAGVCWGLGKTFGVGSTPYQVILTWAGIVPPFDSANGTYIATQDAVDQNKWNLTDAVWEGYLNYNVGGTVASIKPIGIPISVNAFGGLCALACTEPFGASCVIS